MPLQRVKVYLSAELKRILKKMSKQLGMSESELLRHSFIEYARSLGVIEETVRSI